MNPDEPESIQSLLAILARRGTATSAQLQADLQRSQPSVSRLLAAAGPRVLALGAGRSTRYALPAGILGLPAQQPLWWVQADGQRLPWGRLSFLHGQRVHVQTTDIDVVTQGQLPWFLATLRAEGFIGRLLARELGSWGLATNPEAWTLEQTLFAALRTPDAPGAIVLGDASTAPLPEAVHGEQFDALSAAAASTLPAGSSAGGEQAKFLAQDASGQAVLVKFSPPRGTPYGERWHDLLHAENLALAVLAEHGVPVASCRLLHTARRSYLVSSRFDRHAGPYGTGRSHVVPLHAVHDAFVPGPRQHWAATCDTLVAQARLPPQAAAQARALQQFGRLVGNSDMHFGNLSLHVDAAGVARGRFSLAPLYDMLPMRWRPDPGSGELGCLPFQPDPADLNGPATPLARLFWLRLADTGDVSREFRSLARQMLQRLPG